MESSQKNLEISKLLEKVVTKDPRITVQYFNTIFGFFNYYSTTSMRSFIKLDKEPDDPRTYDVIFDALTILDTSLPDYSNLVVRDIVDAYTEYSLDKQNISRSQLAVLADLSDGAISKIFNGNLESKPNSAAIDVYELLRLDLVPSYKSNYNFTNTIQNYRQIRDLIFRSRLGDGFNILSNTDLAEKLNFDVDLFEHPEKICKDARTYNEVANTLYRLLPNYSFNFSKRKNKDTTYMGLI